MNPNTKELLACLVRRIALAEERDKDHADYTIGRLTLAAVEVLRYELERAKLAHSLDKELPPGWELPIRDIEQFHHEPTASDIEPVKVVSDDAGLRYVIPVAKFDDFNEEVSNAAFHNLGLSQWWKRYLVGYDTDAVQFYAQLPVFSND